MRQISIVAGLLLVMGVSAARMADQAGHNQAAAPAAALAAAPPSQTAVGGSVTIPPDRRGHFVVAARVDSRRMNFMLDTGASLVALRQSDASLLGVHPFPRDFNVEVKTANGTTRAAKVELGMVEIENLTAQCRGTDLARRDALREPARPLLPAPAAGLQLPRRQDGARAVARFASLGYVLRTSP